VELQSGSKGNLTARAEAVVSVAAQHAGDVDTTARFPTESVQALKAQRLLGIIVPEALGGESAGIAEIGDVCYQLGRVCASTAMIYAMHHIMTASIVRHVHDNVTLANLLRQLSAEQLLVASSTTEGQGGGNIRSSEAPVVYDGDRISLDRAASVISYGAYADVILTTARRTAEAHASDQVLVAFRKSDYTLSRLSDWNALGMRGTCSEGFTLKATGTVEQIVPEPYEIIHPRTMLPTAHLLWSSVWTGIAAGAATRAQAFIRQAARKNNGQLPPGAPGFTKVLSMLRSLRAVVANATRSYQTVMNDPEALATIEFQSMITLTKVETSELAVAIVFAAMRVCGLSGYRKDSEFSIERSLRDVLSAPIMINNERILANLAGTALLGPVPKSLCD